jgi:hypothetical protein
VTSGRLGYAEKYGWWMGGWEVFYLLMLLNSGSSFNHL